MTEREKMLAGELYLASDPELVEARNHARHLTARYNASLPEETKKRRALLEKLFGEIGEGGGIEPPFYCDYGSNILAGDNLYINFGCVILDCNIVRIGDNVKFGPSVQIYGGYHPIDAHERIAGPELAAPVTIGSNVWIGGGVIILAGVTIGDNTTIGAGSVVTRDIPANVVAIGNPCRVLRRL